MNEKIDATTTSKMILSIKKADASLTDIIYIIEHKALPVAHKLSQNGIDTRQKMNKSFSTLIATATNQHLRFVKLIDMLEKRNKIAKIITMLTKTNSKGDKLMAELRLATDRLQDYIRIAKKTDELADIHTSCESCANIMTGPIADFAANMQHINDSLNKEELN